MRKSWRGKLVILAVLALAATALVALPAVANQSDDVSTGAEIGGGDDFAPEIVCKWELPDMNSFEPGMQYDDDDDPSWDAGYPCNGVDPELVYNQGHIVIQVRANPHDLPEERVIELWSAVRGSNSVSDVDSVFWDVYHPAIGPWGETPIPYADGSFKVQAHGYEAGPPQDYGAFFDNGLYYVYGGSMWAAAYETGQIAGDTIQSQQGLIARAAQNDIILFKSYFTLSKHQPCGPYDVYNYATFLGQTTTIHNQIWVECFTHLKTDFDNVNWGSITPGGVDWVYGDLYFDHQGNSPYPTVGNIGSGGMNVAIEFSDMIREEDQDPDTIKRITDFDAAFGINPDYLSYVFGLGGEVLEFGPGYHQYLCANEVGKLDLSIHPPIGLPAGNYVGDLTVYGYWTGYDGLSPCLNDWWAHEPGIDRYPWSDNYPPYVVFDT